LVQSPVIDNGTPTLTVVNPYILLVYRLVLQGSGDFTWRISDCEELVGVIHKRCAVRF